MVITPEVGTILKRAVSEAFQSRSTGNNPLFLNMNLTGSRAYGYHTVDSDWEVFLLYSLPMEEEYKASKPVGHFSAVRLVEDQKIEVFGYELTDYMRLLLSGTKSMGDLLAGPSVFDFNIGLTDRIKEGAYYTQMLLPHYRGYAKGQFIDWQKTNLIKPLLSCFRSLATGIHLLVEGRSEVDFDKTLWSLPIDSRLAVEELVADRHGLGVTTANADKAHWATIYENISSHMEDLQSVSSLPTNIPPTAKKELEDWVFRFKCMQSGLTKVDDGYVYNN